MGKTRFSERPSLKRIRKKSKWGRHLNAKLWLQQVPAQISPHTRGGGIDFITCNTLGIQYSRRRIIELVMDKLEWARRRGCQENNSGYLLILLWNAIRHQGEVNQAVVLSTLNLFFQAVYCTIIKHVMPACPGFLPSPKPYCFHLNINSWPIFCNFK